MRNLDPGALIALACGVIAFLFRFAAICGIEDQSPAETLRQEWASMTCTWRRLRLRAALLRTGKGEHSRAETV